MLYDSTGQLDYQIKEGYGPRLVLNIDQGINDYYLSLIPKYIKVNRQKYPAHVSVIRKESVENTDLFYLNEKIVSFCYSPEIHFNDNYCWLNIFSTELEDIRRSLGLSNHSKYTLPPDGFEKCFHTTLGNFK